MHVIPGTRQNVVSAQLFLTSRYYKAALATAYQISPVTLTNLETETVFLSRAATYHGFA